MKTLLSRLSGIAPFILFPLLYIVLKRKRIIYLPAFILVIALSGCYLNFYRTNTKSAIDTTTVQKLESQNKYFIVHFQNGVKGMDNSMLYGDTLKGELVTLPPEHSKYLLPKSQTKSRVKHKDKQNALTEVHLYTTQSHDVTDTMLSAPLSTFNRADVYELNRSATTSNHILSTVGVVASTILVVGVIAALATPEPAPTAPSDSVCNCPQLYMNTNEGYSFASGLYSGAVYSTLERSDYLPLSAIPATANNISFKIANAKNEEQFINQVQLLQVNHPADIHVLADRHGNILSYQNAISPLNATTDITTDVKNILANTDEKYYSFDNKVNEDGFSDVTLTFNKPADAVNAKLVIHARNSFWGGYVHKDFLKLFGDSYEVWRAKQEQADPAELAKWQTDQALPLMVYIKTNKGWKFVDYFPLIGNTASRDMIMEINTEGITSDQVEIKLETAYRFWDLDFAAIDYSTNQNFETVAIAPSSVIKNDGSDQLEILLQSDKQYTHLTGDDAIAFEYNVTPATQNNIASYFLVGGGYYHGLEPITGKANYSELYKFRKKGAFDNFSREKFREVQDNNALAGKK